MIWFRNHAEDLGQTKSKNDPASWWQWEKMQQLQNGSVFTGATFQGKYDSQTSMTTRWMSNAAQFAKHLYL
eukprot:3564254-Karenia_brevis.AAC.1